MVKSTKVSNKYDLLEDVETNVKAEIDEDEDEKTGKEKGAEESSVHALPQTPFLHTSSRLHRRASGSVSSTDRWSFSVVGWVS